MKTFKEFYSDANIQEFWNPFAKKQQAKAKPNTKVLAYKDYKSGELDKSTGKFISRTHTPKEQERYGWKPVNVSSYSKKDTPGSKTASGHKFDDNQRLVAVPYKYKEGQVPKGEWKGTPSIPFGTKLNFTSKPMGTSTRISNASVQDTGNFGRAGDYNKSTSYDLALQSARDVTDNPNITSTKFGKQKVYVKTLPSQK